MKALHKLLLLLLASILFVSCEKDTDGEGGGDTPIDIDRPLSGEATIIGIVYDTQGDPMSGVNVSCGNATGITNAKGRFQLDDAPEGKGMVVDFELAGYMTTQKTIETKKGTERLVYAAMTQIGKTTKVDASTGGTAEHNGMSVEFPANSFVTADGSPFTGEAEVEITFVPTTTGRFTEVFPGDFSGVREDGSIAYVESFGFADVNITANGEDLELAEGKTATLTYPIATNQQGKAPSSIPLWYYDFDRGQWLEDGAATLAGNEYVGEVSHFTPWNIDKPIDVCTLTGRVVDGEGNPLPNAFVRCHSNNEAAWMFTTYADEDGRFTTPVEANMETRAIASYSAVSSDEKLYTTLGEGSTNDIGDLVIDISDLLAGWTPIDMQTENDFSDMHFIDCENGWIVTSPGFRTVQTKLVVYRTTDGGETWDGSEVLPGNMVIEGGLSSLIRFRDKNFGVVTSGFGKFYTQDGGETWQELSDMPSNIYLVSDILFGPGDEIGLIDAQAGIVRTSDFGQTWTEQSIAEITGGSNNATGMMYNSHMIDDSEFYLFFNEDKNNWAQNIKDFSLYHTTDKGANWSDTEIMNNPFGIKNSWGSMWGDSTGQAAGMPLYSVGKGEHYAAASEGFFTSTDKMENWTLIATGMPANPSALFMLDSKSGVVGGGQGGLYMTNDGGLTWEQYLTTSGGAITDIHMCDEENGWAIGNRGTLLRFSKESWMDQF